MEGVPDLLEGIFQGLKGTEPLHIEKRAQAFAERLLIAMTERTGFSFASDEKALQAAISMSFAIADEFVRIANVRYDKINDEVQTSIKEKMQEMKRQMEETLAKKQNPQEKEAENGNPGAEAPKAD